MVETQPHQDFKRKSQLGKKKKSFNPLHKIYNINALFG